MVYLTMADGQISIVFFYHRVGAERPQPQAPSTKEEEETQKIKTRPD